MKIKLDFVNDKKCVIITKLFDPNNFNSNKVNSDRAMLFVVCCCYSFYFAHYFPIFK